MDYLDDNGVYSKSKVLNGIIDINNKVEEELSKEKVDNKKVTQLRFEQMLRGIYMVRNPWLVD